MTEARAGIAIWGLGSEVQVYVTHHCVGSAVLLHYNVLDASCLRNHMVSGFGVISVSAVTTHVLFFTWPLGLWGS